MAEKRVIELEIDANLGSLKEQLKAAKQEVISLSEKFGSSSKQVANAADSVRSLEKEIKQTNKTLKSISFEGKFQAITGSIQGVVSGIEGVQGALGIIGIEGESVEKALLRVNSAMALSRGVEGLFEANKSFKQLSTFIKDAAVKLGILTVVKEVDTVATVENVVATEAQVVANQQAAVSFKATGVAAKTSLNGIKGAIAATGIGLLVIALGAIAVYWDDIKAAVSGVSSEQQKLNKLSHDNFETSKEQLSNLDAQDNVLKLQGKSEREILNLKIAKVNTAIKEGIIDLENIINTSKAEEAAAIQNYNMTKKVVDFILDTALFLPKLMLLPIDMAIKGANKVSEALGFGKLIAFDMGKTMEDMQSKLSGFVAGSIFNVPELKKENEAARKEVFDSIKDLRNQKAGFQLSIKEMDKAAVEQSKETSTTEIDANKEKNEELIRLETKSVTDIQAIKLNGDLNQLKNQKAVNELKLDAYSEYLESVKKKEEEELEAQKQSQQARVDLILKYAQTFTQAMSSLNGLLNAQDNERLKNVEKGSKEEEAIKRKMFDRDKKLRIVQTVIDTASNVVTSVRNGGGIPTGIPFGVAAAAMGVLQIAAISKAKFDGGGEQVQSPSGGGGAVAPNFNVIGSSGVNQLAQIQQQPTRAYVVSGDVASGLSLERNRLQNASF
jgi:hypothetical protein